MPVDHREVRALRVLLEPPNPALALQLGLQPDIEVVRDPMARPAVALVEELAAVTALLADDPECRVLVLTGSAHPGLAEAALPPARWGWCCGTARSGTWQTASGAPRRARRWWTRPWDELDRIPANPFAVPTPLMHVPTPRSAPDLEVVVITLVAVGAVVLLLLCTCTVLVARRRSRSRG